MTSTWHHGCSYNGVTLVVENELFWHNSNWVAINCTIHSATHAICLLALITYKYNELQMSCAKIELQGQLQNTYFSHSVGRKKKRLKKTRTVHFQCLSALNMQKHFWFVSSFDHVNFAINGKKLWQSKLLCFTCDLSNI
jgi:hypothetical protein